jgi:hypothetical protein
MEVGKVATAVLAAITVASTTRVASPSEPPFVILAAREAEADVSSPIDLRKFAIIP